MSSTSKLPDALEPNWSDRFRSVRHIESSVLALWVSQVTQWFCGEPLETRRLGVFSSQSPLMTWPPRGPSSTLVLKLNQEIVHDFVLLFLPPCGPQLIPLATGSLEPSLLVYSTLGAHCHKPFTLIIHLHQHQSSRNLHLQYLAMGQSTQHCQSLITPRSEHPLVVEPHMSSKLQVTQPPMPFPKLC
jgi:hypothetical protein